MKILISGSSGLVGKALTKSLANDGHEIARLVRRTPSTPFEIEWHPNQGSINAARLEGIDAVVHLAGESIASGRWTSEKKRAIHDSRVKGTTLLSEALARLSTPPSAFISASAIGYYGNRGDEVLVETSPPGKDFLAGVCLEWENATRPAVEKGIRTVQTRFGIILDEHEGALGKMLTPFRMGVGGRVGSGKQWVSWVALDDVVNAVKFLIADASAHGPVNVVSPNPVTNDEFTKTLGHLLSRPTLLPVPEFGVRLAFGEMADALLLVSQRVKPAVLEQKGFKFGWTTLESALAHILHRRSRDHR
ncbi:MAG TPA: TIGR01777 family oxidoreductase [Pyrinomonadaceae bacterium]|nr:TIGR01777 family oxidoreductase [Pyrinomonadaceae bacterium]